MANLKNIIFIVADSLRYDSAVQRQDAGLTYTAAHSTRFSQARASGCWTLPATASMFTGRLPHEHGATSQTRSVAETGASLAERFKAMGYKTFQSTANPVTTHIFGLDRGFDRVERIWKQAMRRHAALDTFLVMMAKSRVRRNLFTKTEDFIMGRMSDDVEAARSWMQSNADQQFAHTREAIETWNRQGHPVFAFVNVMESHFPYHIADTFKTWTDSPADKVREFVSMFHFVNQTRLTKDQEPIPPEMLEILRNRQRMAWQRLAPKLDDFIREMHEETGNYVVFCSDHGDMFGEHRWQYHFSNVSDAGVRVPIFVLEPEQQEARTIDQPVSMRDLYGHLLLANGAPNTENLFDFTKEPERSVPISESFWYNRDGKTLEQYRFNQFAFIEGEHKYIRRNDTWMRTRIANGTPESDLTALPADIDPIEEVEVPSERREYLRKQFAHFEEYSRKVL